MSGSGQVQLDLPVTLPPPKPIRLHDDVLLRAFNYLEELKDIVSVRATCRQWYHVSTHRSVWIGHYAPHLAKAYGPASWFATRELQSRVLGMLRLDANFSGTVDYLNDDGSYSEDEATGHDTGRYTLSKSGYVRKREYIVPESYHSVVVFRGVGFFATDVGVICYDLDGSTDRDRRCVGSGWNLNTGNEGQNAYGGYEEGMKLPQEPLRMIWLDTDVHHANTRALCCDGEDVLEMPGHSKVTVVAQNEMHLIVYYFDMFTPPEPDLVTTSLPAPNVGAAGPSLYLTSASMFPQPPPSDFALATLRGHWMLRRKYRNDCSLMDIRDFGEWKFGGVNTLGPAQLNHVQFAGPNLILALFYVFQSWDVVAAIYTLPTSDKGQPQDAHGGDEVHGEQTRELLAKHVVSLPHCVFDTHFLGGRGAGFDTPSISVGHGAAGAAALAALHLNEDEITTTLYFAAFVERSRNTSSHYGQLFAILKLVTTAGQQRARAKFRFVGAGPTASSGSSSRPTGQSLANDGSPVLSGIMWTMDRFVMGHYRTRAFSSNETGPPLPSQRSVFLQLPFMEVPSHPSEDDEDGEGAIGVGVRNLQLTHTRTVYGNGISSSDAFYFGTPTEILDVSELYDSGKDTELTFFDDVRGKMYFVRKLEYGKNGRGFCVVDLM